MRIWKHPGERVYTGLIEGKLAMVLKSSDGIGEVAVIVVFFYVKDFSGNWRRFF